MKILLVGAAGYGKFYLDELLSPRESDVTLVGVVEPYIDRVERWEELARRNIPVYNTMEEFYSCDTADLAFIVTPPFLHRAHTVTAVSHGSYVLCEKPLSVTLPDAYGMQTAEREWDRWISIGFQWSFSPAVRALKADILSGVLGAPVLFKSRVLWQRGYSYYSRGTGWAGRLSRDGVPVLDSIVSNAAAHYVYNMLYMLGDTMDTAADYDTVAATLYRAYDIETFDTASVRMEVGGVPLYFVGSHVCEVNRNPELVYEFTNATVEYAQDVEKNIKATFRDGRVKYYGDPFEDSFSKIWQAISAVREGRTPPSTVSACIPHVRLIDELHRTTVPTPFPSERILHDETHGSLTVDGLYADIQRAYDRAELL